MVDILFDIFTGRCRVNLKRAGSDWCKRKKNVEIVLRNIFNLNVFFIFVFNLVVFLFKKIRN
jgi:hypothetical protein